MAKTTRKKYVAKNPNEYKRLRECTHPHCKELGFVSYRNDSPKDNGGIKVEYRCIPHVHWTKPVTVIEGKEVTVNRYRKMDDFRSLLYTPIQRSILER